MCIDLDSSYGDFEAEIMNHELSLMLSASNAVIERSDPLVKGIELAGYLDAYVKQLYIDFKDSTINNVVTILNSIGF